MAQCFKPFAVNGKFGDKIPVPCGKCPFCLKRRASHWALRLHYHLRDNPNAFFITLTYENPPLSPNGFMTLDKRVFQLFMKRLRKYEKGKRLSYYAVGEYGGVTHRPHYHVILFGLSDAIFIGVNNQGYNVYHSKNLERAWSDYHGGNDVKNGFLEITGLKNDDGIKYTTKYITKGKVIPMFPKDDRLPEFSLMSKGLGLNYVNEKTKAYHNADLSRFYHTIDGGIKVSMPRYYRDKIFSKEDQEYHADEVYNEGLNNVLNMKSRYLDKNPKGNFEKDFSESIKAAEEQFFKKARERNKI